VDPKLHQQLLGEFVRACGEGDATTLVGLLRDDAILYSDGGGKTQAALHPIYGADRIIRFLLGLNRKLPGKLGGYAAQINGEPGAVVTLNGQLHSVVTVEPDGDRIRSVYFILNPDKLQLSAQTPPTES
jgi:RNA polymerase sigma-70 factor (ECF subfamily)